MALVRATNPDSAGQILYGTNTLGLSTNATTALFVDDRQRVGIGTRTPSGTLDVANRGITTGSMPAGSVIQVVNTYYTTPTSQSVTGGAINNITGLEAIITPTATSSRILIFVRWFGEHGTYSANWEGMFGITRNGTAIGLPPQQGTNIIGITSSVLSHNAADQDSTPESVSYHYLDSPGTTSALTYRAYFIPQTTETLFTNRCVNPTTTASYERGTSSIMLMEIAG